MWLPKGATKRKRRRPSILEGFVFSGPALIAAHLEFHSGFDQSHALLTLLPTRGTNARNRAASRPPYRCFIGTCAPQVSLPAIPENGQGGFFVSSLPPLTLSQTRG